MTNPIKARKDSRNNRASADTLRLARELAEYRTRKGLTQKLLAQRIGWRASQVARLECAHHEFSVKTLMTYLDGLGLTLEIRPGS